MAAVIAVLPVWEPASWYVLVRVGPLQAASVQLALSWVLESSTTSHN